MQTPSNAPLPKPLRTQLENTVKAARDVAEKAGRAALAQLAVAEPKVPDYLDEPQRVLRRKLRAHARAISATSAQNNSVELQPLVLEVAYEHWHRMLFARFLAENNLLMWREPNDANGAAVSLDDCRDMVDNHPDMAMGAKSHWELAGKLAARMLPQVFKPHSPVFEINFAPEHQRELERLLSNLPPEVFQASDSLGWVYQFWQAKRKDEVNASEVKIGADELPAVTQLFTEPYMVDFLLHNSLGAWWHTRHPGQPCPVVMPYLRLISPLANSPHPNPLPGGEGTHSQTADSGCSLPLPPGEGWGEGATTPQAHHHNVPPEHIAFARSLRGSQTDAENLLWSLLRNRRLADSKFRRQHPLGPYVLDFYCHEKKLAIELDGGQHNEETGRAKDARRTAYLAQQGIRVIRFWNNQTLQETQAVLQTIWDALVTETPSPPTPLPQGEGSNSPPVPGYPLPHPLGEGSNSPPAPGYSLPHPLGEGSNSP
ncbi:MAG: DUF559 domain-containing protein, partial [Rhodoferax sp.]|nr:DUF559 domain-containing protein [Rhodoferax sp.]